MKLTTTSIFGSAALGLLLGLSACAGGSAGEAAVMDGIGDGETSTRAPSTEEGGAESESGGDSASGGIPAGPTGPGTTAGTSAMGGGAATTTGGSTGTGAGTTGSAGGTSGGSGMGSAGDLLGGLGAAEGLGDSDGVGFDPVTTGGIVAEPPVDGEPKPQEPPFQAGSLTAGAWDDNLNIERFLAYRKELHADQIDGLLDFSVADHMDAHDAAEATRIERAKLDIALVIDTTGSMADELFYLQEELSSISKRVEAEYPDAEQRWALVFYRDETDQYETRYFDFRDDVEGVRTRLAEQSADGGGDFPEAAHAALLVTTQLSWRLGEEVSRLAFWLADAPHHARHAAAMKSAILEAQALDIHLYPVASSGVDELTELSMRSAAQLTFGRYLFLTDDSGFGGAHKEPSIPCYFVTRLDDAMLRMIDVEMSGEYREPRAKDILRNGGDPQEGACTTDSGEVLEVF